MVLRLTLQRGIMGNGHCQGPLMWICFYVFCGAVLPLQQKRQRETWFTLMVGMKGYIMKQIICSVYTNNKDSQVPGLTSVKPQFLCSVL